ncbi:mediator of RNA polymerase II transcription subunit 15a-like [Solanum stenotomum]|uniref:mediator of RNA polymerase II transcription subunit 15a-like n=1 Tax=Solanum stenotomum TaxID=172797 RepID=UPI0020D0E381|nr:mediator of RNA polymerase II transcription subunit 15a-like [Solanum stenotomum]
MYIDKNTAQVQTENSNGVDWQEEVYQKIKYLKEMYLSDLNDLYEKNAHKMHQRLENEIIEKLKIFKVMLECIVLFLRLNKQDITISHKNKLVSVEKHISFFLSVNWARSRTSSSPQQVKLHQSSRQLQNSQSLDGQINPLIQPVHGSIKAMQQNYITTLQHSSLPGVPTISYSQHHMINMVKPGSRWDLGQGNLLNSPQQMATGYLQPNPVNNLQHDNISLLNSQCGTNPVQVILESLQQNSNVLRYLLLIRHEQQMLRNEQLTPLCNLLLMQQQLFQIQQLLKHQQAMNSLSGVSTNSNSQQDMINTVQPDSKSLNSLQHVSTSSLQQNPVNHCQQVDISSLSSQSGTNTMQGNLRSPQQDLSVWKQISQTQNMLHNQQLRQQSHHRHMQQQLFQT